MTPLSLLTDPEPGVVASLGAQARVPVEPRLPTLPESAGVSVSDGSPASPALKRHLMEAAPQFDFFRAVNWIERLHPEASPVGHLDAAGEAVFLRHDPGFAFHTGDISAIDEVALGDDRSRMRVTSTFLGLVGATSPLADRFAEPIGQEEGEPLRHFYDVFHHRVLSLLYRVRDKCSPLEGYRGDGRDSLSRTALGLLGLEPDVDRSTAPGGLPLGLLLALAPLWSLPVRSPRTLHRVLEHLLPGVSIEIECFVARRVELAREHRCQLGVARTTLGQDLMAGHSVLDRSGRFRIRLGPLPRGLYEQLTPGSALFTLIGDVTSHFSRGQLEAELELVTEEQPPGFWLGKPGHSTLGQDAQLARPGQRQTRRRFLLGADPRDVRHVVAPQEATHGS